MMTRMKEALSLAAGRGIEKCGKLMDGENIAYGTRHMTYSAVIRIQIVLVVHDTYSSYPARPSSGTTDKAYYRKILKL